MKALLIAQNGGELHLPLDVSTYGMCIELKGSDSELCGVLWRLVKSKFRIADHLFGPFFAGIDLALAVLKMSTCVLSLGTKGQFPFKRERDIWRVWRKEGVFVIPFGSWMYIAYGLRNAGLYCVKTLKIDEADVLIEGRPFKEYMHKVFLGRWICKHKQCGGVAFYVGGLETSPSGHQSIPWNCLRVYPDGTKPDLKDGPCFSCGKMLDGDRNLEFERCLCRWHREDENGENT